MLQHLSICDISDCRFRYCIPDLPNMQECQIEVVIHGRQFEQARDVLTFNLPFAPPQANKKGLSSENDTEKIAPWNIKKQCQQQPTKLE